MLVSKVDMLLDHQNVLKHIDAAIDKWRATVFKNDGWTIRCPLCVLHNKVADTLSFVNDEDSEDFYCLCPISLFTGLGNCENTHYYSTGVYHFSRNRMLSELYDVRRRFIADYICGNRSFKEDIMKHVLG